MYKRRSAYVNKVNILVQDFMVIQINVSVQAILFLDTLCLSAILHRSGNFRYALMCACEIPPVPIIATLIIFITSSVITEIVMVYQQYIPLSFRLLYDSCSLVCESGKNYREV